MKKTLKRALMSLLVLSMLLSAAACGGRDSTNTDQPDRKSVV